ncbi:MAG: undecaprenyl-phosphate glucose phosphotransferase [Phycisphaerae bacterium]|nr:undecaprenyl-phosphate glucose phosphotransferase [Phycisphaerae bacterium]
MLKQRHQLFVLLLACMDALVVASACGVAWAARRVVVEKYWPLKGESWSTQWESYVKGPFVLFAVPITLACFWMFSLYRPRRDQSLFTETAQIIKAAAMSVALLVLTLWLAGNDFVDGPKGAAAGELGGHVFEAARFQFGLLLLLLPVALSVERAGFRLALRQLRRRGWNQRHVAIVGTGRLGQIACRTLERNSWTGIHVSFFVSHHEHTQRGQCLGRAVRGGLERMTETLERHPVDAVYLAIPTSRASTVPGVLRTLERFPFEVKIIPDVPPRYATQAMSVSELDGMPILSCRESPAAGLGGVSKRLLDVVGAGLGIVVLSPVMLVVAGLVRLSGPGAVVFKQRRVSLGGQEFDIYKFRSMAAVGDEVQATTQEIESRDARARREIPTEWTRENDERITPIGRFLRRTSLDELPQLFNVLRGEMSLVGPRPERPELIARFREDWRGYMLRTHVKAGITGWAQVNGLRGRTSLRKRLQYDLFYIRHWSIWFDVRILWLTLFRGFVHENAR